MEKIEELTTKHIIKCMKQLTDRLKTLEDKIEFIMKNSHWTNWFTTSDTLIRRPLQDLWDEQNEDRGWRCGKCEIEEAGYQSGESIPEHFRTCKKRTEPTVKEAEKGDGEKPYICTCPDCEPTVNMDNAKISITNNKKDWGKTLEAKEEDFEPTVKECDCDDGVTLGCKCDGCKEQDFDHRDITELYNDGEISLRKRSVNQDKIEEIISGLKNYVEDNYDYCSTNIIIDQRIIKERYKAFESWLRDKLKSL